MNEETRSIALEERHAIVDALDETTHHKDLAREAAVWDADNFDYTGEAYRKVPIVNHPNRFYIVNDFDRPEVETIAEKREDGKFYYIHPKLKEEKMYWGMTPHNAATPLEDFGIQVKLKNGVFEGEMTKYLPGKACYGDGKPRKWQGTQYFQFEWRSAAENRSYAAKERRAAYQKELRFRELAERSSRFQARTIVDHYASLLSVVMQLKAIMDLVDASPTAPDKYTKELLAKLVQDIKDAHRKDLGIELKWVR